MGERMRLECSNLEEYEKLTDDQLRREMVQIQMDMQQAVRDRDDDQKLQAAIALADSLKIPYQLRIQQLKKLQKSLQLLAQMRRM